MKLQNVFIGSRLETTHGPFNYPEEFISSIIIEMLYTMDLCRGNNIEVPRFLVKKGISSSINDELIIPFVKICKTKSKRIRRQKTFDIPWNIFNRTKHSFYISHSVDRYCIKLIASVKTIKIIVTKEEINK